MGCLFQVLIERRSECESKNVDPLVWTNHRLIQWVNSVDLNVSIS